jgi:hypothetical protein
MNRMRTALFSVASQVLVVSCPTAAETEDFIYFSDFSAFIKHCAVSPFSWFLIKVGLTLILCSSFSHMHFHSQNLVYPKCVSAFGEGGHTNHTKNMGFNSE